MSLAADPSTAPKPKLRAHNILALKTTVVFAMPINVTVAEAISNMVIHRITCALAVNSQNEVEGIFTARDLLRFLHYGNKGKMGLGTENTGSSAIEKMTDALAKPISNLITRREKMVHALLCPYYLLTGSAPGLLFAYGHGSAVQRNDVSAQNKKYTGF
jgi:hypothetical protein